MQNQKSRESKRARNENAAERKRERSAKIAEKKKNRAAQQTEKQRARAENAAAKKSARSEIIAEKQRVKSESERVKAEQTAAREKVLEAKRKARKAAIDKASAAAAKVLRDDGEGFKSLAFSVGTSTVEVEGSQTEFSRRAVKLGVTLKEIRPVSIGKFTVKIRKKDSAKIFAICGDLCYNYHVKDVVGGSSTFARWARRVGLILGGVAAIAFYGASQGFIWHVEVDGLENLPIEAVTSTLKSAGVERGTSKKNVDENLLSDALIQSGKFAAATVDVVGVSLKISVLESTVYTELVKGSNVTSRYDATVTEVSVRSGTALVKSGDSVAKGEPLIEGVVYGTQGEPLTEVVPDGDVYGNVSVYYSYVLSTSQVVGVKTGNVKTVTELECFGLKMFTPKPPFENYALRISKSNFNVFFPLSFYTYVYEEVENRTEEVELSELTQSIVDEKIQENEFSGLYNAVENVDRLTDTLYRYTLSISGKVKIN